MIFDGTGLIIFGVFALLSWLVGQRLRSKFSKYSKIRLHSGISGAEAAAQMLRDNNITDVRILSVPGRLTDHFRASLAMPISCLSTMPVPPIQASALLLASNSTGRVTNAKSVVRANKPIPSMSGSGVVFIINIPIRIIHERY